MGESTVSVVRRTWTNEIVPLLTPAQQRPISRVLFLQRREIALKTSKGAGDVDEHVGLSGNGLQLRHKGVLGNG